MNFELRLKVNSKDLSRFASHPLIKHYARGAPSKHRRTSVHFDTPDYQLSNNGLALWVECANQRRVQTLEKNRLMSAGLRQRWIWNSRVNRCQPDLDLFARPREEIDVLPELLSTPKLNSRLAHIFTTELRSTVWTLSLSQVDVVELVLQRGKIQNKLDQKDFCEIVLTLQSGEPVALFRFAQELLPHFPFQICTSTRPGQAHLLLAPLWDKPVMATAVVLANDMSIAQGLQVIAGNCLTQIQGNELGVIRGNDPEYVHQMRVGLRRLKSALSLFKTKAPCPTALLEDLTWIRNELGAVRDWEVLLGEVLPMASARSAQTHSVSLQKAILRQVNKNRRRCSEAVISSRYTQFILEIGGWLLRLGDSHSSMKLSADDLSVPLIDFAKQLEQRRHKKLKKEARRLSSSDPETRHRVRIAAKKVRYVTDFFASFFPPKKVRPYLKSLSSLQDALGLLNDVVVADKLLELIERSHPGLTQETRYARGYLAGDTPQKIAKLNQLWRRFKRVDVPSVKKV